MKPGGKGMKMRPGMCASRTAAAGQLRPHLYSSTVTTEADGKVAMCSWCGRRR